MLIDEYLPYHQFSEKHTIKINSSRNQVQAAIMDLTPNEISFLFRLLFQIRSIPPKMLGRPYIGFSPTVPLIGQLEEKGFRLLEKNNREILLGVVGHFGKLKRGEITQIHDFKNLNGKETGKVATNFLIQENDDNVLLSTETRICILDEIYRRRFRIYWMIVHPGSAFIRKIWLKAIKKRAEK